MSRKAIIALVVIALIAAAGIAWHVMKKTPGAAEGAMAAVTNDRYGITARDMTQGIQVGANIRIDLGRILTHLPPVADNEKMGFVCSGGARQMDDARGHDKQRVGCHRQRQRHLQNDEHGGHLVSAQCSNDRAQLHACPAECHEKNLNR